MLSSLCHPVHKTFNAIYQYMMKPKVILDNVLKGVDSS